MNDLATQVVVEDSLKKRYLYKLLTKIATAPIMLITQALIPRALGPAAYGQFTFLSNFFQQVISFFDSGTSLAFYTKLSKDLKDTSLIRFYSYFIALAALVVFLGTSLLYLFEGGEFLFPGQSFHFVLLAILYALLIWLSEFIYKIVDAHGLTVSGELILIGQRAISFVILAGLYFADHVNLFNFFLYNCAVTFLLILWWVFQLYKKGISLLNIPKLTKKGLKEKTVYFWNYSFPLISYSFLGMIVGVFDNWLLIKISGSEQQGYFGLAFKLSSISFIFTGAMSQLITREFSVAHAQNDKAKIASLFEKYIPLLYVLVSFLSVFFAVNAKSLTYLFGGAHFGGAFLPIAIMSLYPIHQTYGQLSGSLFYATNQTRLYRNIGIALMPVSLILTYFLIAPVENWGLNLGATGLALKMLAVQFIGVNIQLYYNTKYLSLRFFTFLRHQFFVVFILLLFAFLSQMLLALSRSAVWLEFILSGTLYLTFSAIFFYAFPKLLPMERSQINEIFNELRKKLIT